MIRGVKKDRDTFSKLKQACSFLIILQICLASCSCSHRLHPTQLRGYGIIGMHADDMLKMYDLKLHAVGGAFHTHVSGITTDYVSYGRATLEEARASLIKAAESLLKNVRQSKEIKTFLCHDPFDYKDITVSISFLKNRKEFSEEGIAKVALEKGHVTYSVVDKGKKDLKIVLYESYPQALVSTQEIR